MPKTKNEREYQRKYRWDVYEIISTLNEGPLDEPTSVINPETRRQQITQRIAASKLRLYNINELKAVAAGCIEPAEPAAKRFRFNDDEEDELFIKGGTPRLRPQDYHKPEIFSHYLSLVRSVNISTIISSQYYFNVTTSVRTNTSGILIFRLKRNAELALIRNELSTPKIHDELFDEILHKAQEGESWNFLFVDNMTQKFYRNFSKEYDVQLPMKPIPETEEKEEKKEERESKDDIDQEIERQVTSPP